jgi:small subunit ribosomal protein S6
MRIYEVVYIIKPDVSEEDADKFIAQMEQVITSSGGAIQKTDKWGRRRLAYQVRKCREGQYVVTTMECESPALREFERILKVSDPVIKYQTVRIDEELKRLEKIRREREKRSAAKRPGAPQAPAPPAPLQQPQPSEPTAV